MKRTYVLLVTSFLVFVSYQYIAVKPSHMGYLSAPLPQSSAETKQPFNLKNLLGLNKKDAGANVSLRNDVQKKAASSADASKNPPAPLNVADVNQQLQDIIKLNDSLKINQVATAAEIQQIQEQAKIHQQLLRRLETTEAAVNRSEVNEVLRQEKIRIIREQTSQNTEIVKTLERQRRP